MTRKKVSRDAPTGVKRVPVRKLTPDDLEKITGARGSGETDGCASWEKTCIAYVTVNVP